MNILDKINSIIQKKDLPDFKIDSYIQDNLVLTGSHDFCYYHEIEIKFKEVYYISLPSEFYYPLFRLATLEETQAIEQLVAIELEAKAYCIEAEITSSIAPLPFYLVAEAINVCEEKVYYYSRENLRENEKIADWAKL